MRNFTLLNNKEIKKLNLQLKEQFGNEFNFKDYLVYITPKKRISIVSKEFSNIDPKKLRINNIGLYFLTKESYGLRLSIDGSQIFKAKKNILELNNIQFKEWMTGKDIITKENRGFIIIKHKDNVLGCGYSSGEKIVNYVPKERRVVFE